MYHTGDFHCELPEIIKLSQRISFLSCACLFLIKCKGKLQNKCKTTPCSPTQQIYFYYGSAWLVCLWPIRPYQKACKKPLPLHLCRPGVCRGWNTLDKFPIPLWYFFPKSSHKGHHYGTIISQSSALSTMINPIIYRLLSVNGKLQVSSVLGFRYQSCLGQNVHSWTMTQWQMHIHSTQTHTHTHILENLQHPKENIQLIHDHTDDDQWF